MQKYICSICNKEFYRYESQVKNKLPTCSNICRNKKFTVTMIGTQNPNYGKQWSDIDKQRQSSLIKSKVDDVYREKCAKANRGKVFSNERINKMHSHRSFESYSRIPSDITRQKIGFKSKLKFTPEYKQRMRNKNELTGDWIPLHIKPDYVLYRTLANWKGRMFDLIDDPGNLLSTLGVFNVYRNRKGIVRDHMYSRRSGFEHGVFPELLRHPCNCQLLTHSNNLRKKMGRYKDADSITLIELFSRILLWKNVWAEQDKCVILLNRYNSGERYDKNDYIDKYYE